MTKKTASSKKIWLNLGNLVDDTIVTIPEDATTIVSRGGDLAMGLDMSDGRQVGFIVIHVKSLTTDQRRELVDNLSRLRDLGDKKGLIQE